MYKKQLKQLKQLLITSLLSLPLIACQQTPKTSSADSTNSAASELTLTSIYQDKNFKSEEIGQIRWLDDGSAYLAVEKSAENEDDNEIVSYNPTTLARTVLVTAKQLTPQDEDNGLTIDNYIFSDDNTKLLIYTNSKKVWRSKSRGDYWLFDFATEKLTQLGGKNVDSSQLMFAKFSADASKVAYVLYNNIYLQNLTDFKVTQLTFTAEKNAGNGIINGLFDWVYEEEFLIRDGFRWSPDGKKNCLLAARYQRQ